MILVFLGYPGSGKGTQAKMLSERKNFIHISTGDLFREEISKNSELGLKVKGYISQGKLVPDDITLKIIEDKIQNTNSSIIFDGFPRTVAQAEGLDNMLEKFSMQVDKVIFFEVDEKEVVRRISARRFCPNCQAIYNLITNPPKIEGKCDKCGADLAIREDDKESVVMKRIEVYKDLTSPLISYYRTQGIFYIVNASLPQEEVYLQIENILDGKKIEK